VCRVLTLHLVNGIAVTVTPIGLDNIGWKYYLVWAVLNASFIPIVYFLYPETKGLSLEEIDHVFVGQGYGWDCMTQGVKESIKGHPSLEIDSEPTVESARARDEEKGFSEVSDRTSDKRREKGVGEDSGSATNIEFAR